MQRLMVAIFLGGTLSGFAPAQMVRAALIAVMAILQDPQPPTTTRRITPTTSPG